MKDPTILTFYAAGSGAGTQNTDHIVPFRCRVGVIQIAIQWDSVTDNDDLRLGLCTNTDGGLTGDNRNGILTEVWLHTNGTAFTGPTNFIIPATFVLLNQGQLLRLFIATGGAGVSWGAFVLVQVLPEAAGSCRN